jgi:hypothetical protein
MKTIFTATLVIFLAQALSLQASDEKQHHEETFIMFASGYLEHHQIYVDRADLSALYNLEPIAGKLKELQYVLKSLAATENVLLFVRREGKYGQCNINAFISDIIRSAQKDRNHKYFSLWQQMEAFNELKGNATCRDPEIQARMQKYIPCETSDGHQLIENKFKVLQHPNLSFIDDKLKNLTVR